jgi:hypothetical protein
MVSPSGKNRFFPFYCSWDGGGARDAEPDLGTSTIILSIAILLYFFPSALRNFLL